MKKYFSKMLLLAAAVMTVAALASCDKKDSDTPKNPEPEPVIPHVKYLAKFGEDLFDYAEVTVTIHCNGKDTICKMDETTKVADVKMETLDIAIAASEGPVSKAGRVLQIPPFMVNTRPITITTDIKLTEAGRQKIAQATTENTNFIAFIDYGVCNQKGLYLNNENRMLDKNFIGVHVADLEKIFAIVFEDTDIFNCTFK